MTLTINIVSSASCPACKMCASLMPKISFMHPDVNIAYLDANDKAVRRFQRMNLNKPVDSIRDPALRKHYKEQGLEVLNGLPTIYGVTSNRPQRVLDLMVGFISPDADYETQQSMIYEMDIFIRRLKVQDRALSMASKARFPRRREF